MTSGNTNCFKCGHFHPEREWCNLNEYFGGSPMPSFYSDRAEAAYIYLRGMRGIKTGDDFEHTFKLLRLIKSSSIFSNRYLFDLILRVYKAACISEDEFETVREICEKRFKEMFPEETIAIDQAPQPNLSDDNTDVIVSELDDDTTMDVSDSDEIGSVARGVQFLHISNC